MVKAIRVVFSQQVRLSRRQSIRNVEKSPLRILLKEFHAMNGLYRKLAIAAVVVAALGSSNQAEAALRLTLTSGGTTQQFYSTAATPNAVSATTSIDGYTLVIATALTNFIGSAGQGIGTLVTSTSYSTGAGPISDLTILAEVVAGTDVPTGSTALGVFTNVTGPAFLFTNVTGNGAAGNVTGTSTSNGVNVVVGPLPIPTLTETVNQGIFNATGGYTLTNTTVLTGVAANLTSQGVQVRSTVTAVPEPATVAMALSALPLMGLVALRRRRKAD
jgi:hypothetical protein